MQLYTHPTVRNSHSPDSTVLSLFLSLYTHTYTHIDFLLQQTKINNDFSRLIKHNHFGEERGCLHWIKQTWSSQFSLITLDLTEALWWDECSTRTLSLLDAVNADGAIWPCCTWLSNPCATTQAAWASVPNRSSARQTPRHRHEDDL